MNRFSASVSTLFYFRKFIQDVEEEEEKKKKRKKDRKKERKKERKVGSKAK